MNYSNAPGYEPPQTMMQKLQQDRRIRLQEHRRRVLQGLSFVHLYTLLFRFGINKCLKQSKLMYTDTRFFALNSFAPLMITFTRTLYAEGIAVLGVTSVNFLILKF